MRRVPTRRLAASLAGAAFLGAAAFGTAVAATARTTHWGEILVNVSGYLGASAVLAASAFALARRGLWMAAAGALGAYHLAPVAELYVAEPPAVERGPTVDVATVNVHYENEDASRFLDWIDAERPAVLGVLEVTPYWRAVLGSDELTGHYPHRLAEPVEDDGFAMMLLSEFPLRRPRVHETPYAWRSYLEASVDVGGSTLHVVLVHPQRPGRGWGTLERNAYLMHVAQGTRWGEHSVLFGDFNATLWSPLYRDVVEATGLVDSRRGFGWLPSWRSVKHVEGVWLDLDHILVGRGIGVLERSIGVDIGSDHRPATARLQLFDPPGESAARPDGSSGGAPRRVAGV